MGRIGMLVLWLVGVADASAVEAAAEAVAPVRHIVVVWLKQPGDAGQRAHLIREMNRLEAIPGMLDVAAGAVIESDRAVVDSSFDVAIVFTLRDREALTSYVDHPLHQEVLQDTIRPLVQRYVVYDIQ